METNFNLLLLVSSTLSCSWFKRYM